MSKYSCNNCNKNFRDNYDLNKHINKKNPCKNNVIIDNLLPQLDKKSGNIKKIEINILQCQYCNKIFSTKYCMKKHIKNNCKSKKEFEQEKENILNELLKESNKKLQEENEQLKIKLEKATQNGYIKEIKALKKIIKLEKSNKSTIKNSTINSNNNIINSNNKTTNNIIMVDHGKEDLNIIDNKYFTKLIKNTRMVGTSIPNEVLKIIHFNEEYPQLSNIYISDINRHKCMIYENSKWNLSPEDRVPQVIRKVLDYSNEKLKELGEKYCDDGGFIKRITIVDKYTKLGDDDYIQDLIEDNASKHEIKRCEDFKKKTYGELTATLYNKREMAEKSLQSIKQLKIDI